MKRSLQVYGSIGLLATSAFMMVVLQSAPNQQPDRSAPSDGAEKKQPPIRQAPEPIRVPKLTYHAPPHPLSAHTTPTQEATAEAAQVRNSSPVSKPEWHALVRDSIQPGDPEQSHQVFGKVLRKMLEPGFTPEDAWSIRGEMKKQGANRKLLNRFDRAWAANQPEAAVAYLDKLPEGEREPFLRGMIPGLASESPQMAIELFESMGPKVQARIRPKFLEGLVDNGMEVATQYLYDSSDPKKPNWRPMDELARELVRDQGLASTLQWANGLPKGRLRHNAWSAAYAVWGSQDAHAAVQSIMELPKNMDRNLAINGLVSAHAHKDGERAVQWASEITEPNLRKSALLRVGRQYYKQDPLGATEWFDKSGLPQSTWDEMVQGK